MTTNLTPDGIAELRDNRLISRLQGLCLELNVQGGTSATCAGRVSYEQGRSRKVNDEPQPTNQQ